MIFVVTETCFSQMVTESAPFLWQVQPLLQLSGHPLRYDLEAVALSCAFLKMKT